MFFNSRVVPATPPSLVKLYLSVSAPDDWPGDLDTQQRPGAGAEVAPVGGRAGGLADGGHGRHGTRGVVRAGSDHGEPAGGSHVFRHACQQRPDLRSRLDQLRQDRSGKVEGRADLV